MTRYSKRLRGVHGLIISALERDAKEGRPARGEMAAELKVAIAEQYDSHAAMSDHAALLEAFDAGRRAAQEEVHRLRSWIKDVSAQYDICTHNVLKEICDGCRCERSEGKK